MDAGASGLMRPVRALADTVHAARTRVALMNRPQRKVLAGMVLFILINIAILAVSIILISKIVQKL